LINEVQFNDGNFTVVNYIDNKSESRPMYIMDEEFTTVLIMGFTGSEALKFKLEYIKEFIRMREILNKLLG